MSTSQKKFLIDFLSMEKGVGSSLFVNDGSFMEKFKQLQKEKEPTQAGAAEESKSGNSSIVLRPNAAISKIVSDSKASDARKSNSSTSNGKLAFSLKQKSKLAVAPVKLGADEDEDEVDTEKGLSEGPAKRQKLGHPDASEPLSEKGDVAYVLSLYRPWWKEMLIERIQKMWHACYNTPSPPTDPTVKKVADKLASFVAKNGRQFEHITRQRNPGDTPFKFLFDVGCADYKYYEHRLTEEEKLLAHAKEPQASRTASTSSLPSRTSSSSQRREAQQLSNYQIPASALYEANEDSKPSINSTQVASVANCGEMSGPTASDPIAMMEFYMKKAAQEERMRGPKQSKDEMPPPASLQAPVKKGHHMGDYIPQEELEKFLANCNDAAAQKAAKEAAEKAKIQADNVGHKLLSKMGWKEGEGLGSSRSGRADPVMAGNVKLNNLGLGAEHPGEVTPDDDIYEQYKKRMMLGYRYRPNPLNNPRKAYY